MKLSDIPEIKELLKVLEENGLLKEQNDVKTLVSYIEDMETKLFDMSTELKEMHGEVGKSVTVPSVQDVRSLSRRQVRRSNRQAKWWCPARTILLSLRKMPSEPSRKKARTHLLPP